MDKGETPANIRESMMAARIFRRLESKQARACTGHDSAPLKGVASQTTD